MYNQPQGSKKNEKGRIKNERRIKISRNKKLVDNNGNKLRVADILGICIR